MAIAFSFFTAPTSSSSSFSSSKALPSLTLSSSFTVRFPRRRADRFFPLCSTIGASVGGSFGGNGGGHGGGHGHGGHGGGGGDEEHSSEGKNEALMVVVEAGRALDSVPADLATAIKEGKIPAAVVTRFLELEKSAFFRWLLQFPGFRERLLADDLFLAKVAMECGVGVFTKVSLFPLSLLSTLTFNINLYSFALWCVCLDCCWVRSEKRELFQRARNRIRRCGTVFFFFLFLSQLILVL